LPDALNPRGSLMADINATQNKLRTHQPSVTSPRTSRQRKVAHRVVTSQTLKMQVIQLVLTETGDCRTPAVDFRNGF
jgi:N-acetylmuramic acid 6-phosphate (MurNAc-6-P) etherase